jgi:antitoxin HicB
MAAAYNYPVEIFALSEEDGRGFLAIAPDLRGCMADGWTRREALANLHDAIPEWITDARAMGRPVPEPKYYSAA